MIFYCRGRLEPNTVDAKSRSLTAQKTGKIVQKDVAKLKVVSIGRTLITNILIIYHVIFFSTNAKWICKQLSQKCLVAWNAVKCLTITSPCHWHRGSQATGKIGSKSSPWWLTTIVEINWNLIFFGKNLSFQTKSRSQLDLFSCKR